MKIKVKSVKHVTVSDKKGDSSHFVFKCDEVDPDMKGIAGIMDVVIKTTGDLFEKDEVLELKSIEKQGKL